MACYYSYMKTISKQVNMTLFELPDSVRQTIIVEKSKCALKKNNIENSAQIWIHLRMMSRRNSR